ncbi:general transcription factor IIF subunit 1-like protein [Dinothrombium tinctorium]|uniref:Transcription initiation factor IIF subunit alpha n=1 Tax=Dinothrombium tinctorium TaxID=1965070 RepID=A0A443R2N6_9ACAR|nr:general transcription factor IIF subunit 1-like protein [Dinothrombium tinctorium]RWS09925.1 general transcription factor IIF subunit 1-like protein [Dinothrombium tinctorium]RWS11989.1 general transcription factor IIF subunit 1-like protein [Dinothrombium tinctorium]
MSQSQEFVVRVPRETKKRFHVMRFSAALNVDVTKWKSGRLERENNIKEFKGSVEEVPKYGAGSEFGRDMKEEARRKKYGITTKKYKAEDQPWILRVNGREGRKYRGIREGGVSENTSYYVFFQAHDGAFEAFSVSEWYNFIPIPKYKALTAEEAEEKFVKRDKILNYFSVMASKKKQGEESGENIEEKLVKKKKKDFKVSDMDDWNYDSDNSGIKSENQSDEEDQKPKNKLKGSNKKVKKGKGKKKGSDDEDDDSEPHEDSDEGDFDTREVDYMSSSSSSEEEEVDEKLNRELKGVEDEDALRQLVISDEEEEEEENREKSIDPNSEKTQSEESKKIPELDQKVKIKQEKDDSNSGSSSSSEDSDDSDFDDSKFQSAMFMQKKVNKSKNGSDASKSVTDSSLVEEKDEKHSKSAIKRKLISPEAPVSKKPKSMDSNVVNDGITEEAVKRYLMRKPMTTTELLQKFKSKKIPMGTDFTTTIAQIIKKLNPEKQTIKGKLYLSIKPS